MLRSEEWREIADQNGAYIKSVSSSNHNDTEVQSFRFVLKDPKLFVAQQPDTPVGAIKTRAVRINDSVIFRWIARFGISEINSPSARWNLTGKRLVFVSISEQTNAAFGVNLIDDNDGSANVLADTRGAIWAQGFNVCSRTHSRIVEIVWRSIYNYT